MLSDYPIKNNYMSTQQQTKYSQSKKIELIIQQLSSLPTLPAVAARLLQITVRSDTQANEVVSLIESDPSLASRIITLATRANMGISRSTASLSKAVVLLGFDAVRNAVLSIKVFEALQRPGDSDDNEEFDRVGFWKHSLAVACASRMLVSHIDSGIDPEEAFVCGLLHDIGKLALDSCLPKSYARVVQITESSMDNISDVERKILGLDHTVAGRRLALRWNLPEAITESIWLHHQWVQGLPDAVQHQGIVRTVHMADVLARQMRLGYSGNHYMPESAEAIAELLGCPATVIEQVARQLPEAISERASLLGLDDVDPDALYHDALSEANSELGHLNEQLRLKNQKLTQRSRYLDLLCDLDQSLQNEQSVVDVCGVICKLWFELTGCERCGVYAYTRDKLIIEGAVKIDKKASPSIFLVDRTEDPQADTAEPLMGNLATDFAVLPVTSSHYWFFEQVAPMFETDSTVMIPLRSGRDTVGALLWQTDQSPDFYRQQIREIQTFAAGAALAVRQARKQEQQSMLCEQLAQSNIQIQKSQQELLQKRSLAVVGEMACGAAHEINNPLAVVVGRAQLLASKEQDSEQKDTLEAIADNGQKIAEIIRDLLEFAQPAEPTLAAVTVAELFSEAADSLVELIRDKNIEIQTQFDNDLPELFVDRRQIGLALMEVIGNAIESYDENGGVVTLRAGCSELEDMVNLEVIDQGCGMDEQILRKAAGPFFSARRAGRKRGLGLSRSIRYIEGNGGRLHLDSQFGHGTCVRITLPVANVAAL
ncbi:MAG: HDOD domain-containing protein [Sedimentisphaerales bacterium]|nr:HDOD domain-containing protein [Sedimentisphaerales bacterium]